MKEFNKDKLQDALQNLPLYAPSVNLWDKIHDQSAVKPVINPLQEGIQRLPEYTPSEQLWSKIEGELRPQGKPIVLLSYWKMGLSAAAILVACLSAWLYFSQPATIDHGLVFSEEVVDDQLLVSDLMADDDADFDKVIAMYEASAVAGTPELEDMNMALSELTEARDAIYEALGAYGAEPKLVLELASIEKERTTLLKDLLNKII